MSRSSLTTKLCLWALKGTHLVGADRIRVINSLLGDINALPTKDAISFTLDGTLLIRGQKPDIDQTIALKQQAASLKSNSLYKLIHEQILLDASIMGVRKSITAEDVLFGKAGVWMVLKIEELINKIDQG